MCKRLSPYWSIPMVFVAMLIGCKRQPDVAPKPELTPHVSFTNAAEEVTEAEVHAIKETGRVEADLNLDGQNDLILMRTTSDNIGEVEVFLRKSAPESKPAPVSRPVAGVAPMMMANMYIRVGTIRCSPGARIVGIASRKRGKFTDLIVLVGREGEQPQLVHYLNDGTGFTEQF